MKVIISLGSKSLVLEPETEFEKEVMCKYFRDNGIKASVCDDGSLDIKWSGPASRDREDS